MTDIDKKLSGNYPRVLIAGSHGSAGKTTFTLGLIRALKNRGYSVQPFKKGPDFIDPLWHSAASGRTSRNLDFFMMKDHIRTSFILNATGADISLIEGNKGLFDGLDTEGSDSTSALARHLEAPVILVVDCFKMTRGIAPLVQGYLNFEKDLQIYIVLNNVAGKRHEQKLKDAISHYTDAEVLGVIYRESSLEIDERHLGLVPSDEVDESSNVIQRLANSVETNVNLDRIIEIEYGVNEPSFLAESIASVKFSSSEKSVRIGIARDRAFSFYYPENLEALQNSGADLIPFSPLYDSELPDVDAIFLGGGFPEMHMEALSGNTSMIHAIQHSIQNGMPVYAECGGLMYLSRSIQKNNQKYPMLNILPFDTEISDKPYGRGYMIFKTENFHGDYWSVPPGLEVRAHEFHYSHITNFFKSCNYAYKVIRGSGMDGHHDGIIMDNIFASYVHLHTYAAPWWAGTFINAAKFFKKNFNKTVIQSKEVFA